MRKYWGATILLLSFSLAIINTGSNKKSYGENYFAQNLNEAVYFIKIQKGNLKNGYWRGFGNVFGSIGKKDTVRTVGRTYLTLRLKSKKKPEYGDIVHLRQKPSQVKPPDNPGGFDMRAYLNPKGVYHTFFAFSNQFKIYHSNNFSIFRSFYEVRSYSSSLMENNLKPNNFSIANALVLGDKSALDSDIKKEFGTAGAMHILAVSGLHVGIVVLIINSLIGYWRRKATYRWLYVAIGLICIWFYAFLTGLPVSVQRAGLMFSIYVIGSASEKNQSAVHSVLASALILLLINPYVLWEVGFQLSYAAVLGIIIIQPRLNSMFYTKFLVPRKMWELTTVSIAAQIATLPFSLYYFEYFPSYFLLTNLFVLPLTPFILILGLSSIVTYTAIPILGKVVFYVLDAALSVMNQIIHFISSIPGALMQMGNIPTYLFFLLLVWSLSFAAVLFYYQKKVIYLCLLLTITAITGFIFAKHHVYQKNELVVFKDYDEQVLALKTGAQAQLLMSQISRDSASYQKIALPYLRSKWLDSDQYKRTKISHWLKTSGKKLNIGAHIKKGILKWDNKSIGLLQAGNSSEIYSYLPDFILVKGNQYVDMKKLKKKKWDGTLILDGSNSFSFTSTLERLCKKSDIEFYNIKNEGAFVYGL